MRVIVLALCLALSVAAEARSPRRRHAHAPPLMPTALIAEPMPAVAAAPPTRRPQLITNGELQTSQPTYGRQVFGLGAELGIAGRATDASGSVGSTQLFLGGRIVGRLPIARDLYLKPSVGFFYKNEGSSSVGLNQYVLETGLVAQWAFAKSARSRWLLGLANRVDFMWNQVAAFGTSGSSPMVMRYRVGPAVGGLFGIAPDLSLSIDTEVTFSFGPVRPAASLTAGFVYYWD